MTCTSVRTLEATRFIRSQLSTILATLGEWACVWLLVAIGVWYVLAAVVGASLGALIDFSIKKRWVFATSNDEVMREGRRYIAVSGASALLFGGVVYLLVDGLGLRMPTAVVTGSILVGILWNYPMHRLFVFSTADRSQVTR